MIVFYRFLTRERFYILIGNLATKRTALSTNTPCKFVSFVLTDVLGCFRDSICACTNATEVSFVDDRKKWELTLPRRIEMSASN